MDKHTPGPWHIQPQQFPRIFDEYESHLIAVIHGDEQEKAADACLIAAAPDLLYAARRLIDYAGEDEHGECEAANDPGGPCAWCNLRAAIAKATQP